MSIVFKKEDADKIAFNFKPKPFQMQTSEVAKDFVKRQKETSSGFEIASVVAEQAGISALKKQNLEMQVEETVLERLKEIQEQAYRQAYELGIGDGSEKAFQDKSLELTENIKKFDHLMSQLEKMIQIVLNQNEAVILKTMFQIAERIAMREIKMDQKLIIDLLNHILSEVQADDSIQVKINPADFKFIEDLRAKGIKSTETIVSAKLLAQENISIGGCLVETNYGTIDASIEQRVERAWQTIESKLPIIVKDDDKT